MLLLYGNYQNIPEDCIVFNFCGLIEKYQSCNLIPPNNLGAVSEYDFDLRYMHWIIDNDSNFTNFMNIIMQLYYGKNVYLITSDNNDDWSNALKESLLKLIQQRYGIEAVEVDCLDDIVYAKDCEFSEYGIINLDQDKERYLYLYESYRISNGGQVYNE
jgi:hypothetical protein